MKSVAMPAPVRAMSYMGRWLVLCAVKRDGMVGVRERRIRHAGEMVGVRGRDAG